MLAGVGPVGLYYFFSPGDRSAARDVAVLNKIWGEGRIGVVGIPVKPRREDVVNYLKEMKPRFPIRNDEAEGELVRLTETPALYLALPLQRTMFRLGSITEATIREATTRALREALLKEIDSNG